MSIRNPHWSSQNELIGYPLDDAASRLDDNGKFLPSNILQDLRIRWPVSMGKYAFISAVTATARLVTVLISVTTELQSDGSSALLLAGLTVAKSDLTQGRTYRLEPFSTGVGGFIAIGSVEAVNFSGKFSRPMQTLLSARAARPYRPSPVSEVKLKGAEKGLTGLINLTATAPLQLTRASRDINGQHYENVVVLGLLQPAADIQSDAPLKSVFATYSGKCGGRVNAKSCGEPSPVLSINGVTPDCDGVITLDFRGCAVAGKIVPVCGLVIDCDAGISTTCKPSAFPRLSDGVLPSELNEPAQLRLKADPYSFNESDGDACSMSESMTTTLLLPYCETFDSGEAYGFSPVGDSSFGFAADDSPAEDFCCGGPPQAATPACYIEQDDDQLLDVDTVFAVDSSYGTVSQVAQTQKNISIFGEDVQTCYRKYLTDMKAEEGPPDSKQNGGIVLNYRWNETAKTYEYWLVQLNISAGVFGLYFFNGVSLVLQSPSVVIPELRAGDWYRLSAAVVPDRRNNSQINITATLQGIYNPGVAATLSAGIRSSLFLPDYGQVGLYANRSRTLFSFFRIEEADV